MDSIGFSKFARRRKKWLMSMLLMETLAAALVAIIGVTAGTKGMLGNIFREQLKSRRPEGMG